MYFFKTLNYLRDSNNYMNELNKELPVLQKKSNSASQGFWEQGTPFYFIRTRDLFGLIWGNQDISTTNELWKNV